MEIKDIRLIKEAYFLNVNEAERFMDEAEMMNKGSRTHDINTTICRLSYKVKKVKKNKKEKMSEIKTMKDLFEWEEFAEMNKLKLTLGYLISSVKIMKKGERK